MRYYKWTSININTDFQSDSLQSSNPYKSTKMYGPIFKPLITLSFLLDGQGHESTSRIRHTLLGNDFYSNVSFVG